MKRLPLALGVLAVLVACPAFAQTALHYTTLPGGAERIGSSPTQADACPSIIRYDDGTDDTPGSSPTLGWWDATQHQYLFVRFAGPSTQMVEVRGGGWFSDFWVQPGLVDVTAEEVGNPGNSVTVSTFVYGAGNWEVEFPHSIVVPPLREFYIKLCPHPGGWGVVGDDSSNPHRRSGSSLTDCAAHYNWAAPDLMVWACAVQYVPTFVRAGTWGSLKSIYR